MGRHLCSPLALVLGHDVRGVDGKTSVGVDGNTEQSRIGLKYKYNYYTQDLAKINNDIYCM